MPYWLNDVLHGDKSQALRVRINVFSFLLPQWVWKSHNKGKQNNRRHLNLRVCRFCWTCFQSISFTVRSIGGDEKYGSSFRTNTRQTVPWQQKTVDFATWCRSCIKLVNLQEWHHFGKTMRELYHVGKTMQELYHVDKTMRELYHVGKTVQELYHVNKTMRYCTTLLKRCGIVPGC